MDTKDFFELMQFDSRDVNRGDIILAEPLLMDPFFKRSVVFMVQNNDEATIGFMLNRPVKIELTELVEGFPEFNAPVYWGGPVSRDNLYYIHTLGKKLAGSIKITKDLYWGGDYTQLLALIEQKAITPKDIRFFAGYSGWDPDQLEMEVEENSWIVRKANTSIVMNGLEESLWETIMLKLGGKYKIMTQFPEDPTLN